MVAYFIWRALLTFYTAHGQKVSLIEWFNPRQMEAQANTTREQSNKNNIYDVGLRPLHGENGGEGKKKP